MDITELTVHELKEKLDKKELTSYDITKAYVDRINEKEKDVNAFVTLLTNEALEKAKQIDNMQEKTPYSGIPIGIKDNMCTKGIKTTCSSKMLENFVSPYDGTVVNRAINEENMINLGKLNMDEFAMRKFYRNFIFRKNKKPMGFGMCSRRIIRRISCSSSWKFSTMGIGIRYTGGSIRQPASLCRSCWIKTYIWTSIKIWTSCICVIT